MLLQPIHVAIIGGVRPHFIKIAALQSAIKNYNLRATDKLKITYINSNQHYDPELTQFINELGVHFDFTISHPSKDPVDILGNMIIGIHSILKKIENLDIVIVIGDTSTTLAGAIAASRCGIPVIHIEAGIRSGDLSVIEEIHRRAVDHISAAHFCITKSGVENLRRENISRFVYWTGDLSYNFFLDYAQQQPDTLDGFSKGEYILVTLHKSSNFFSDHILRNTIQALKEYSNLSRKVIFVTHPKTRKAISDLALDVGKRVTLLESLPYNKMLSAIKGSYFILTDSGGVQKEAYYLRKRCLVRRDTLGWSNLIDAGIHKLTGKTPEGILTDLFSMEKLISSDEEYPEIDEFIRQGSCEYALEIVSLLARQNLYHTNSALVLP